MSAGALLVIKKRLTVVLLESITTSGMQGGRMSTMLRVPELALGALEREVLDALWSAGAMTPIEVHERVGAPRAISLNTVSSALKRLYEKKLLHREKVSHSYVYSSRVTRVELQRLLIGALAQQFGEDGGVGLFAAFVDLAEERGEDTLRHMEQLIAARLAGTNK
jgi:predicted transcriptional regulator